METRRPVGMHLRFREVLPHQGNNPDGLTLARAAIRDKIPFQLVQDRAAPARRADPGLCRAQEGVTEGDRIEHGGVEDAGVSSVMTIY